MLVYVHCWFHNWLKPDPTLLDGFLNVEAEDPTLIGTVVGNIVELAIFLPFKFFSQRDHMVCR